jgi:hypothetical protein
MISFALVITGLYLMFHGMFWVGLLMVIGAIAC